MKPPFPRLAFACFEVKRLYINNFICRIIVVLLKKTSCTGKKSGGAFLNSHVLLVRIVALVLRSKTTDCTEKKSGGAYAPVSHSGTADESETPKCHVLSRFSDEA